jgi:hypothetical protein
MPLSKPYLVAGIVSLRLICALEEDKIATALPFALELRV